MRIESAWQDLRYAVRGLRAKPGFAAAIVATLALGIGANAAMFGIVDRLLFRAPSYLTDPARVNRVYLVRTFDGKENYGSWFQYTRYTDLARSTTSFDVAAGVSMPDMAVGVGQDAREMRVGTVSATYWSLFDARPVIGRFFTAAEDTTPRGAPVAVISYAYWQSRYGGRSDVLGQQLKIAAADYTIIGVTPPGFAGDATDRMPVAWIPITTYAANEFTWNPKDLSNWYQKYNISWMQMIVRRKPGVSLRQATADLSNAYRRSYEHQREIAPRTTLAEIAKPRAVAASILAERGPKPSEVSRVARWVTGVALLVLLIAAANVANLLLARALRRRREVAVRLALGVSRARLLSQLLTESLLLAALGGVTGLIVAHWGTALLRALFLPTGDSVPVLSDTRTLVFGAAAVVVVGVLTGLAPAWQSGRTDLTTSLKSGAREGTYHRSRTRVALLVFQGALSVVLLIGAGLFVRSMNNVRALRMGYDVDRLLWVGVEERGEKLSGEDKEALRNKLQLAARELPGVESASRAVTVPFWMSWDESLFVQGFDTVRGSYLLQGATADYFRTMGTRILRGRGLQESDTRNAPLVMVVSDAMAKALWPATDAIGQCVRVGADTAPCTTVVGVAENIRAQDLRDDKMYYYYRPIDQAKNTRETGGLFVRVRGDAAAQGERIRRELQKLMPGASYVTARPMTEIFDPEIRSWRLGATMFVAFGGLALVLAAIGLYSVIAYNVVQRTHEMGVRVAFGAQMRDVVRLILGEGLRLALLGVVIGGALALYAGRWVAPLLFNVKPADPTVYGTVIAVLLASAALASAIPALRAAKVDPSVALRSD
ncbi:MAG TPA: ADOP family duplicated permease [Gemmatimonadaceae bacterium]|nr:ADOP family duplicated permease [Gemmatimonadaceae bacterium]